MQVLSDKPARKTWQFSIRGSRSRAPGQAPRPRDYTEPMRVPLRPPSRPGSPARCQVPEPLPITEALNGHSGLARLGVLIRESNRRMEIVAPALPGALSRFVRPGPIDEEGWTLMAANAAIAAKLRHLQPRLEQMLAEQGLQPAKVRVKVQQQ